MWILFELGLCLIISASGQNDVRLPPSIKAGPDKEVIFKEFEKVNLTCRAEGTPPPTFEWRQNGKSRSRTGSASTTLGVSVGDLTIFNATKQRDEGFFQCFATNKHGTALSTVAHVRHAFLQDVNISVQKGQTFISPTARGHVPPTPTNSLETATAVPIFRRVSEGPYNVNVTEGDSVTFNCFAFAKPNATVVWLRNGHQIDLNATNLLARYEFSNENRSLTIRNVCRDCVDRESKTDLMVIQCNASNVHGYAFAQGYLNVLMRTNVTLQPPSTFVSVDLTKENRFQFDCTATSDPSTPPTFRWYKVGEKGQEPVISEPPFVYVMDGNLTIYIQPNCSNTSEKYFGEYNCIGDNGYTQDTATVILNGTTAESCPREFLESSDAKLNWSCTTPDDCFDKRIRYLLVMVYSIQRDALNQSVIADIARIISTLTNRSEGLSSGNLNDFVTILDRLAFLLSDSNVSASAAEPEIKAIITQSIIQSSSSVLRPNNFDAWRKLNSVKRKSSSKNATILSDKNRLFRLYSFDSQAYKKIDSL